MSEHELVWTHDRDVVRVKPVCNASADADCRLVGRDGCECEQWNIKRDSDGTPYHLAYNGVDEYTIRHEMKPGDDCNFCLFLDNGDCIEEQDDSASYFEIGRKAIEPVWQGDYYDWKPVGS